METKKCSKCNRELEINCFSKHRLGKNGLRSTCRDCEKESFNKYKENNKEKERKRNKAWREENKEHLKKYEEDNKARRKPYFVQYNIDNRERLAEYNAENADRRSECHSIWYAKNKDIIIQKSRLWRQNNKEYLIQWRQDNKEKIAMRTNRWREKNKPQIRKTEMIWRKNNIVKCRIYGQNRKAREMALPHTLTVIQWEQIKTKFDNKCCYCGKKLPLEQEHFMPLSKGGEYTIENIVCACRSCNASKNDRDFFEWYPEQKYYTKKREKAILKYLKYKNESQQLALTI